MVCPRVELADTGRSSVKRSCLRWCHTDVLALSLRGPAGPNLIVIEAKTWSELARGDKRFDCLKLRAHQEEFGYGSPAFTVFG